MKQEVLLYLPWQQDTFQLYQPQAQASLNRADEEGSKMFNDN